MTECTAERGLLCLPHAALCLHLLEWLEGGADASREYPNCPVMRSMELDLLAHSFQRTPPMGSQCETHGRVHLQIVFPDEATYLSEGRTVRIRSEAPVLPVDLIVTSTTIAASGIKIWHLSLTPTAGGAFTEYDLIRLIHLYDGRTEASNLADAIRFRVDFGPPLKVVELLRSLCPECGEQVDLRGGTVQVLTDGLATGGLAHDDLLATVRRASANGSAEDIAQVAAWLEPDQEVSEVLCAYAGIVSGILDFHGLDVSELLDTLEPTCPAATGLMRMHRSTLSFLVSSDRAMTSCWDSVGISPYLILPHAALLHNEALLERADRDCREALEKRRGGIPMLESVQESVERDLFELFLPNVFHYPTERMLFERAWISRGAADRRSALQALASELGSRIEAAWEARRDQGQMCIAVLLALISIVQIKDIVFEVVGERWGWPALGGLAIGLAGLIVGLWRMGTRR